jgi:hypothetical protein
MNKQELHELAKVGMVTRLRQIERDLAAAFAEFPDLFLSATPPQLLRPEPRAGSANEHSNGHWPIVATKATRQHRDPSQVVPYLVAHGPTPMAALAVAMHLKSRNSLSSTIRRGIERGLLTRVSRGVIAATDVARAAASGNPAETRKRPVWSKARRAAQAARMRKRHRDGTGPWAVTTKKRKGASS